jgi:hypothetical protein
MRQNETTNDRYSTVAAIYNSTFIYEFAAADLHIFIFTIFPISIISNPTSARCHSENVTLLPNKRLFCVI